jgi:hypothetical protein
MLQLSSFGLRVFYIDEEERWRCHVAGRVNYIKLPYLGQRSQVSTYFGNFCTKLSSLRLVVTDCVKTGLIAF